MNEEKKGWGRGKGLREGKGGENILKEIKNDFTLIWR